MREISTAWLTGGAVHAALDIGVQILKAIPDRPGADSDKRDARAGPAILVKKGLADPQIFRGLFGAKKIRLHCCSLVHLETLQG